MLYLKNIPGCRKIPSHSFCDNTYYLITRSEHIFIIFCLKSREMVSDNEKQRYICNVFSYWFTPYLADLSKYIENGCKYSMPSRWAWSLDCSDVGINTARFYIFPQSLNPMRTLLALLGLSAKFWYVHICYGVQNYRNAFILCFHSVLQWCPNHCLLFHART